MKEIILIKNGELALKGLNRGTFEAVLVKNMRRSLNSLGSVKITRAQSTIVIEPTADGYNMDEALSRISKVFGIAAYCRAAVVPKTMDDILNFAPEYLADTLGRVNTFKVEARRADKTFPLKSPEICAALGERLLEKFPHLKVDVHSPDEIITVEVRDFGAYIHSNQLHGAGGMPVSTGGRATVLISGGIDSPVAAWMMAKRGIELNAVHFASPPYTGPRAENKVHELLKKVAAYSSTVRLETVHFTEIQEQIADKCPEEYFTLIMRRFMMRIAAELARRRSSIALITGESLGQVASQTLPALNVTDCVAKMPTLRPLIGMDKDEIIAVSRKIDTFDISIQPYEDCCTVFTPKHPKTRPVLENIEAAESVLDIEGLCARAVESVKVDYIEAE